MISLELQSFDTHQAFAPRIVPLSSTVDTSRPAVFLIPGFLTERDAAYGPECARDCMDADWARQLAPAISGPGQRNVFLVNWPSAPVLAGLRRLAKALLFPWSSLLGFGLMTMPVLLPFGAVSIAQAIWRQAVRNADMVPAQLSCHLARFVAGSVIIGHSLGGRIALRMAETYTQSDEGYPSPEVIALAPAVSQQEIKWACLDDYPLGNVELFYSTEDKVLRYLFRLGQASMEQAIGHVGMPHRPHRAVRCIDATDRPYRKARGHSDYEPDLMRLLDESDIWLSYFSLPQPSGPYAEIDRAVSALRLRSTAAPG